MSDSSTPKFKALNSSNYNEWSGDMKAWLMKYGYWKLVSGKEGRPKESTAADLWDSKAKKAAGKIYLCLGSDQKVHVKQVQDDPVKIWAALEKVHVSKRPGARFNAYNDLFAIQKKEDESLSDLATRIERAMASIRELRSKEFTIEQLDKELQAMALIRSLPPDYKHLSSNLLLQKELDPDSILDAFKAQELNEESQLKQEEMVNSAQRALSCWESACQSISFL